MAMTRWPGRVATWSKYLSTVRILNKGGQGERDIGDMAAERALMQNGRRHLGLEAYDIRKCFTLQSNDEQQS